VLPPPTGAQVTEVSGASNDSNNVTAITQDGDITPSVDDSTTPSADADTAPAADTGAVNCGVNSENGESNESKDLPQSQNLKRSLSDRSPDRCVQPEKDEAKEDKSPITENKSVENQDDQPLIKRRNVALYSEEPVDD